MTEPHYKRGTIRKVLQVPTHFVSYDATDEDIDLMKGDEFI